MSCSLILLNIPCRLKLSCVKNIFSMPARKYKAQLIYDVQITTKIDGMGPF